MQRPRSTLSIPNVSAATELFSKYRAAPAAQMGRKNLFAEAVLFAILPFIAAES